MPENNLYSRDAMIDYLIAVSPVKTPATKRRARRTLAKLDDAHLRAMHDDIKAAAERNAERLSQVEAQLTTEKRQAQAARKAATQAKVTAALTKLDSVSARIRLRRRAAVSVDMHING